MLQTIHDSLGRWVAGIILGLLAVAFIFWGIDFNLTGANYAAKVNGETITLDAFDRELQNEQSQYAELYRAELSEELRRQLRINVIERLVRNTALRQHVEAEGYRASNERLLESIRSMPAFQIGGEFSMDLYRARLLNQGLLPAWFEDRQRDALALTDLQAGISESAFLTPAESRRYIELFTQRREIGYALFEVDAFSNPDAITDAAIEAHYEISRELYRTEETVDLEYIRLRAGDLAGDIEVSDADLEAMYEEDKASYQTQEERRARHILIAGQEDDADAQARAQAVMDRITGGEDFEAVAREVSEDPGTRAEGGDLGWISRGLLVGPFEDALFSMQAGELRGPIATDFGWHIIRLDEIRPATLRSFEDVKPQLREQTQQQRAEDLFYQRANELADLAFDAYDELASVAAQLGLPLASLEGFPRSGDDSVFPNSVPVVQAAFSDEVLQQGANSGLVELAADDVLVLRVAAHHPSVPQPLDLVRDEIRQDLARLAAQQQASDAAAAFRTALESGETAAAEDSENADIPDAAETVVQALLAQRHGGIWVGPTWVSRTTAEVPSELLAVAYQLPRPGPANPIIRDVPLANGDQAVLVLSGVQAGQADMISDQERETGLRQLADQTGLYELSAYAAEIRDEASVQIPDQILNPPPMLY